MKNIQKMLLLGALLVVTSSEASSACKDPVVEADAVGQVRKLIAQYDNAKTSCDQNCFEKQMRVLLRDLKHQTRIFEGASKVEVMGGDMDVSPVNKNEALQLKQAAAMVEKKLSEIDEKKAIAAKKEQQKKRQPRN
jgi:hypothetical protein